jgi:hypothetical protein
MPQAEYSTVIETRTLTVANKLPTSVTDFMSSVAVLII